MGTVGQLGLDALALGDVAHVAHHPFHTRVVEAVGDPDLEPPQRTVRMPDPDLHPRRLAVGAGGDRPEEGARRGASAGSMKSIVNLVIAAAS